MTPRHPRAVSLFFQLEANAVARNAGYWNSQAGRLLRSTAAVCATAVDATDNLALKADLAGLAADALGYLNETLDACVLSREDVETKFEELRARNPDWPEAISETAWRALERSYYLRDITNVICDGGGFWEAIEAALYDQFRVDGGEAE